MAFKLLLCVAAVMGAANAGLVGAPLGYAASPLGYAASPVGYASAPLGYAAVGTPTITSGSSNTLRSFGNQGQISHEAKTIQTPFSSSSRSDIRVSNDAQILAHGYASPALSYAAPAVAHTYAAPAVQTYAAPAVQTYAAPAVHSYAAPALSYAAAPAVHSYAAPAVAKTVATTYSAPATQLLGVAYSAAPAVAHMTYSNGLGITYSY